MQIAIALVTLALCGGFLWWFRRSENRRSFKRSEEESAERERKAQETAQEFVNAKDLGNNCLYTTDGFIFAYIKIEGLNLELYSRQEQKLICRELSAALSGIKRPYKSDAVSRPADISRPLSEYQRLYNSAAGGRKKLLSSDMNELAAMVTTGETLERQHYIAIWDTVQRSDERTITAAAQEIVKKYTDNGIHAEPARQKRHCSPAQSGEPIPAYVHIENTNIEDVISVLSDS